MQISLDEAIQRYGAISAGKWADESKHCEIIPVTQPISLYLINSYTGAPTTKIYGNKDMTLALMNVFQRILSQGLQYQLKSFDGCFEIRDVRAMPGHLSCHSYGLAVDINAKTNQLGTQGDISDELAACFTHEGFIWGKTFHRMDPMHFQYASW